MQNPTICTLILVTFPVLADINPVFRPKDWMKFRSNYYKFYTTKRNWHDALADCKLTPGATLVSLIDKQEEDYVTRQMNLNGIKVFHIGLTAATYPGTFEWLDGSSNSYRNWVDDSYKKFAGKPLLVSVGVNGWFASDGETKAAFICKYTPGRE